MTAEGPRTETRGVILRALIEWKLVDQPDKPRSVVERWADWFLRGYEAARLADPALDVPLDVAWREAEAALPDGWWLHALYAWSFDDMAYRVEAATAGSHFWAGKSKREKEAGTRTYAPGPEITAYGPTPAAALQALAARLREAPDGR